MIERQNAVIRKFQKRHGMFPERCSQKSGISIAAKTAIPVSLVLQPDKPSILCVVSSHGCFTLSLPSSPTMCSGAVERNNDLADTRDTATAFARLAIHNTRLLSCLAYRSPSRSIVADILAAQQMAHRRLENRSGFDLRNFHIASLSRHPHIAYKGSLDRHETSVFHDTE